MLKRRGYNVALLRCDVVKSKHTTFV